VSTHILPQSPQFRGASGTGSEPKANNHRHLGRSRRALSGFPKKCLDVSTALWETVCGSANLIVPSRPGAGGEGRIACVRAAFGGLVRRLRPPRRGRGHRSAMSLPKSGSRGWQAQVRSRPEWAGELENLRLSSLNGRKMFEAPPLISGVSGFGPARLRSQRRPRFIQLRAWIADEMGRNEPPAGSTSDEPRLSFDDEEKNGN
jgi:hypothetical protein